MISIIIKLLEKGEFYNGGNFIEIAKGKNELVTDWKGFKRKAKRIWQQKKK